MRRSHLSSLDDKAYFDRVLVYALLYGIMMRDYPGRARTKYTHAQRTHETHRRHTRMDAAERTEHNIRTYNCAYKRSPLWVQDDVDHRVQTASVRTAQREQRAAEQKAKEMVDRLARKQLHDFAMGLYAQIAHGANMDTRK